MAADQINVTAHTEMILQLTGELDMAVLRAGVAALRVRGMKVQLQLES